MPPDARRGLARLRPGAVAYVSCDPETLARDLDHLARLGLAARELVPFDMIPLTDHVETVAILQPAAPAAPRVLYEDEDVVALDKPPHEPTTPQGEHEGSLLDRARAAVSSSAVPVHRLDVGTSGVVFFARDPSRVARWSQALGAPATRKVYLAATRGAPEASGVIDRPLTEGGRSLRATTRFEVIEVLAGHALLELSPDEGRTHQLRRHLASIGHPVLGDARYGHAPTNRHFEEKYALDRTFLHCSRIELAHPRTGELLRVQSELPGDLTTVLDRMKGA
jgi:23S rRNA (uracil1939-C5)-methyltransferase